MRKQLKAHGPNPTERPPRVHHTDATTDHATVKPKRRSRSNGQRDVRFCYGRTIETTEPDADTNPTKPQLAMG